MKVVATAQNWFVTNSILHYSDVAIMASREDEVNTNIIDVMIADGVNEMKTPGPKTWVKKYWVAMRAYRGGRHLGGTARRLQLIEALTGLE